jgi:hypothetical protein
VGKKNLKDIELSAKIMGLIKNCSLLALLYDNSLLFFDDKFADTAKSKRTKGVKDSYAALIKQVVEKYK